MTTYSICNQQTGETLARVNASSASEALEEMARNYGFKDMAHMGMCGDTGGFVATAVGLPEAPAPAACPFKLPLTVGNSAGQSPDQIYDITDQAVLILYSVDSRGTVDEARTMAWNQEGLRRGDYVVKAVNEHEGLVNRVERQHKNLALMAKYNREFVQENRKLVKLAAELEETIRRINSAVVEHARDEIAEHLTAKPVDRRKD